MKTTHCLKTLVCGAVVALFALAGVSKAHAVPILGQSIVVASTGHVVATFLGHTAAYSNDLYLDSPANSLGIIFNNHAAPVGSTLDLGLFAAGTELIFRIHVNNTGYDFFSGPGSRNPDGLEHAIVDDTFTPTETFVGFEDLLGGGDRDYDDLKFSFTNVRGTSKGVPEASSTLPLLCMGLGGLMAFARRLRK